MLPEHQTLGRGAAEMAMVNQLSSDDLREVVSRSEMVVVIGGDGTVSRLLGPFFHTQRPPRMGLMPIGTSNDLARALGAPLKANLTDERVLRETIDRIVSSEPLPLDVFCVNGQFLFCNYFSIGFDAAIVKDFDRARKSRWIRFLPKGRILNNTLYFLVGLKKIGFRLPPPNTLLIEYSGEKKRLNIDRAIRAIIVTNLPLYAGGCRISPRARIDDGVFEVSVIDNLGQYLTLIGTRFIPFLRPPRGVRGFGAHRVEMKLHSAVPCQIDGEQGAPDLLASRALVISQYGRLRVVV
jgi:diacylglycerol kinase (ATP)